MSATWHIITRVGESDGYAPGISPSEPRLLVSLDSPSAPNAVRHRLVDLVKAEGLAIIPDTVRDLFNFATAVYTADVRIRRGHADNQWTRNLALYLPVTDLDTWLQVVPIARRMLRFLTGDEWSIELRKRAAHSQGMLNAVDSALPPSNVCLFSGGLDSFCGAIDLLHSTAERVFLVGHYGAGTGHKPQEAAWKLIDGVYAGRTRPIWCYVQPPKGEDGEAEQTMRSRSLLFLALGICVTVAAGPDTQLWVPENGLISLNVPLTPSRSGSLSTRTTHPYFIGLFRQFLVELGIKVPVRTPYRFKTKGEMMRECRNPELLRSGFPTTMSCSRPDAGRFQGLRPGQHCGYCIPCLIRRAALHAAGLDRPSDYNRDVVAKAPKPTTAAGRDRRALEIAIERWTGLSSLQAVGEVLSSGPLPPEEVTEFAGVFRRGLDEVAHLLKSTNGKP